MGLVIAFPLLLIGVVFVLFETGLQRLSSWLLRGCKHLLQKPPYMKEDEYTEAKYSIACLAYLVFPVGVLYGEAINLQSILSQLNETGGGAAAAVVDQASMLLYLFVPAFLFMVWLELRDMPLFGLRLLPTIDEKVKKGLGKLTLVVLILAGVVFVCIWLYRALALAHPDALNTPTKDIISLPLGLSLSLADIRIFLFALMGIVAFYTTAFAVIGLKVGLIGLGMLITGGLWVIASALQFFCHVAAQLLSYPCLFLTQGRLTPYTELADIKRECELRAERKDAEERGIPYGQPPESKKPIKRVKVHAVLCAGDFGSDFFPDLAKHVDALGAQETILSSGVINPAQPEAELLTLPDTRSLSSTPEDLKRAHDTARAGDDRDDHVYRTFFNRKGEALMRIHTTERLEHVPAAFFFVLDKRVLCPAEEMLRTVHGKFPAAQLVVMTAVTAADRDRADEKVQRGLTRCQTLWNEGVLAATLVFDDLDCPFLKNRQDKPTLYSFMSRAVASLLVAKKHFWHNLAATEVLDRLSQQSAFITVSFASAQVPAGPLPARYGVTKVWPGKRAEKGTGDVTMTIQTLKGLIRRISDRDDSQHESTRSLAAPVNDRASSYLVYNVPLSHREVAKLEQMRRELNSFAGINFPLATLLLSRGRGVPYGDEPPDSYRVGVSCFYSVHRSDFSAEQTVEAGKGTRALPQPQQFAAAQEQPEEEEEPLAPFTVESEPAEQRVNGDGGGRGGAKDTAKGAKRQSRQQSPKRAQAQQQQQRKQVSEPQPDTAQESSTAKKRGRGRPRKLPVERS